MKNFKGFTLIELLIVIALLGALAVGLLAALDPFEQLKKGTDTGVRNTVSEFQGATIRYFAIKNFMPWCTDIDTDGTCLFNTDGTADPVAVTLTNLPATIAQIVATGELKTDFETLAGSGTLGKIIVFGDSADSSLTVCYKPTSKSFTNDPNTKFDPATGVANDADPAGTCTNTGDPATNDCLWCVK
ncbi:MAG: hypothetical protein UR89_C0013G0024 [Candidatus Roizmanbacteria bacterium GW2011_GWA2_35_8]|uniref:Prepilin-type N-terminal cleavage/methylation domain-containing protein n=1 Tax=Candidatus Roizmanbacteria bacterium GW2011_GWA2_35_8 TaxID=1618479 RepID=A0A0G0DDS7_9BACT|nr:MAG: hypothetical protein UR89_C0013G0024 [Candidatus Roizmanbacteria bacterium GW2011_GWA2_35_8]